MKCRRIYFHLLVYCTTSGAWVSHTRIVSAVLVCCTIPGVWLSHNRIVSAVYDTLHGGDYRKGSLFTKPSRGTRLWVGIRASCSTINIHEAVCSDFKIKWHENVVIVGRYEAVKGYPYFGCPCSIVLNRQNLSICVWRALEFMAWLFGENVLWWVLSGALLYTNGSV